MAQSQAQATMDSFIETQETSCSAKHPRIVSSSSKGSDFEDSGESEHVSDSNQIQS